MYSPLFLRISLFTDVYKKMPRVCKYIQSFTWVCSVKSSIESGYTYQHFDSRTLKESTPFFKNTLGWLVLLNGTFYFSGVGRVGTQRFGNHYYWISWLSNEPRLGNYKWDWFNARDRSYKSHSGRNILGQTFRTNFSDNIFRQTSSLKFWTDFYPGANPTTKESYNYSASVVCSMLERF
jgi:hypothetical protein